MTSKAPSGRRGRTSRLSPWTSRSSASATRGGSSEAATSLHAHDVMDTPGCGRVGQWAFDGAYAPPPCGDGAAHAARGGPHRGPRSQPRPGPAAERAGTERRRWRGRRAAVQLRSGAARRLRARCGARPQPRALRQEPRSASWPRPGAPRTGGRSSTASHARTASTPACSRRSSCSRSAGRADARASDDLRSAAGLTQILAETGQNLLGLHIDVKASERLTRGILRGHRVAGARGRPPARRRALRPGQGDRGDRRATWTSPRASSAATTSRSSATTWASATCSRR